MGKAIYPKIQPTPLYIVVNDDNYNEIKDYLTTQNHGFGLRTEDILFVEQASWPMLSNYGKILMESTRSLHMRPCGTGSVFEALMGGAVQDMKVRGVRHVMIMNSDNVLSKVADPFFIGFNANMQTVSGLKT